MGYDTPQDLLDFKGLVALEAYRHRLFEVIKNSQEGYKSDCGQVRIQLPGISETLYGDDLGRLCLSVRCYPYGPSRSHNYWGVNLAEAVAAADADLTRWVDEDEI